LISRLGERSFAAPLGDNLTDAAFTLQADQVHRVRRYMIASRGVSADRDLRLRHGARLGL